MPHNPERTRENLFVLPGDPEIWTPKFRAYVEAHGDDNGCVLCGKPTGGGAKTSFVLASHRGTALPVDEMPADGAMVDGEPYDEGTDTLGCFPIGRECLKALDAKFVIKPGAVPVP